MCEAEIFPSIPRLTRRTKRLRRSRSLHRSSGSDATNLGAINTQPSWQLFQEKVLLTGPTPRNWVLVVSTHPSQSTSAKSVTVL